MIRSRRLAEEGTPFEREVLASSRLDRGSEDGLKRTLAAMGLGAAAVSTTTSTAGAGMVAGGTATAAASGAGVVTFVKWVGLAVVVAGSATAASVHWVGREGPAPASSSASRTEIARPVPPVSERAPTLTVPMPPPAVLEYAPTLAVTPEPTAVAVAPRSTVASQRPATPATSVANAVEIANPPSLNPPSPMETPPARLPPSGETRPSSSLDAEIAALDAVRTALARGDAHWALDTLSTYDRTYPASVFAEEAAVLRIDALTLEGDRVAAAALSLRFLAAHPSSAHAHHVRQVLATQNP